MTTNELFLAKHKKEAVSVLEFALNELKAGHDPIGSIGAVCMALAAVHTDMALVVDERDRTKANEVVK